MEAPNNIKVIISKLPSRLDSHVRQILADRWNEGQRDLRGKLSECLVSRLSVCVSEFQCEREREGGLDDDRCQNQCQTMAMATSETAVAEAANSKNLEQKLNE